MTSSLGMMTFPTVSGKNKKWSHGPNQGSQQPVAGLQKVESLEKYPFLLGKLEHLAAKGPVVYRPR